MEVFVCVYCEYMDIVSKWMCCNNMNVRVCVCVCVCGRSEWNTQSLMLYGCFDDLGCYDEKHWYYMVCSYYRAIDFSELCKAWTNVFPLVLWHEKAWLRLLNVGRKCFLMLFFLFLLCLSTVLYSALLCFALFYPLNFDVRRYSVIRCFKNRVGELIIRIPKQLLITNDVQFLRYGCCVLTSSSAHKDRHEDRQLRR